MGENMEEKEVEDVAPTDLEHDRSVSGPSEKVVTVVPEIEEQDRHSMIRITTNESLSPTEEKGSDHQEDEVEEKPVRGHAAAKCEIAQSKTEGQISGTEKLFWARKRREDSKYELSELDHARFKLIAHKLYDKYLRESSPLEINISSEQRARHRRYDQMDYMTLLPKDWIRLYDDVLSELEAYIVQSYKRMILKMDKDE